MLASATDHYRRQNLITRRSLIAARKARWGSLDNLVRVIAAGQLLAARDAASAVPLMLAEQDIDATADAEPAPRSLTFTASDGRSLDGLMDYTRQPEVTPAAFDLIVTTQIADAARGGGLVSILTRPAVNGYVRMLEVPSCSRCVVLAGKWYRTNTGFDRHPRCDCRHIPASEDTAGDLRTDPQAYFDSLPSSASLRERYPDLTVTQRRKRGLYSQEDIFTDAGAKVIREGADIGQVVNARAGMSTAQPPLRGNRDRWTARGRAATTDVFGRPLYTTTEGMTKRGIAHKARGRQYVRLMPESIVQLADGNRAELLRLLKVHGYTT